MRAYESEEEPPLDAAQERLRRKLVRLLFVSGGIMALGLIAVFAAIVYRVSERTADAGTVPAAGAGHPAEATIPLPPGYRVTGTSLDGGRMLLTLTGPEDETLLLLVDLASGTVLGRYTVAE
jgi:hypothetical protein